MATTLRRRVLDHDTPTPSPEPLTPQGQSPARPGDKVKIVHHHHPSHGATKTRKRRNTFIFLLGSLFGIIAAGLFAKNNDLIYFPELGGLSMDSLLDVLPAGLVKDMTDLVVCCFSWLVRVQVPVRQTGRLMDIPPPPGAHRKASAILSTATTPFPSASRPMPRASAPTTRSS